jgi:hypothetical protein
MPISSPKPPREILQSVRASFAELASKQGFGTPALRAADPRRLAVGEPHPVYTLGLRDIVEKRGPADATFTAWRWLVQDGTRTVASAEVGVGQYEVGGVSEINEGPFVRSTEEALAAAEKLPTVRQRAYEPRLLKIPGVYLVALWLHAEDDGGDDVFVVLAPAPYSLRAGEAYRWADLQRVLVSHARTRIAFDEQKPPRRRR